MGVLKPKSTRYIQSGPPSEEQAPKKSKKAVPFALHHKRDEPLKQKYETEKYAWKPKEYKLRQITQDEILEISCIT